MVQTSDEQSGKTYVEIRKGVKFYHTAETQTQLGWFWCCEKKGLFRYSDWNLTIEEMEKKYG